MDSLRNLIQMLQPDIITLCEIKSTTAGTIRSFFSNEGYEVIPNSKSGLAVAAKSKHDMVNITHTDNNNIISASIKIGLFHLTTINVYGPQESEKEEVRSAFFDELATEITIALDHNEHVLLIGDFNSKIMKDKGVYKGISPNGHLLNEIVNSHKLTILNLEDKCSGKWTRVQEKNGVNEKSVIDYAIASDTITKMISDISIDEEKLFAPFWNRKSKRSGTVPQYSDHNAFLINIELPKTGKVLKNCNTEVQQGWRITENGMQNFAEITEEIDDNSIKGKEDTEIKHLIEGLMDSCFQRKKTSRRKHPNVNTNNIVHIKSLRSILKIVCPIMKHGKIERRAGKRYVSIIQDIQSEMLQQSRASRVTNTLQQLESEDGSLSVDKFWKLKKKMTPNDRSKSSIIVNNKELWNGPAIIKEYEKEFTNRLAHRKIDKEFETYEKLTKKLLDVYLKESAEANSEPDFTDDEIDKAIISLTKGTAPGPHPIPPDVYKIAGYGLRRIIKEALNQIKRKLSIPPDWLENLIVTIFKNKGSRKVLKNYRGVFLGDILTKILEKVIKGRIGKQLANINILQAGSRANRSPSDSLFLLRGVIDHAKYLNKKAYITFYDYSTCFDSLWLDDCMISLWDIGIRNELFHLIFKLNETTRIQVKTPFGTSDSFNCHRIVKQGSVLSSNFCSASTGELCDENYDGFAIVGSTVINDTLYVDDTTDLNTDINETIESHNHVVNFSKAKRLGLNVPKCGTIIVNKRKHDSMPSLWIDGECIKQMVVTKFLGDMINEKGNNMDLINDRTNKGKSAMVNCISLCSEVSMGRYFVQVAILLYFSVFLSTILFNCQAWSNLTKDNLKKLETIQLRYLKRVMRAPTSTSNCFVFLELGLLPIQYIIHIRQLTFLQHILLLDDSDPVYCMYIEQLSLPYEKNWGNHIQLLLNTYNLAESKPQEMSRPAWKQVVNTNVSNHAFLQLTEEAKEKTKTQHLVYSEFAPQQYIHHFHPKTASTIFKIRSMNIECKSNRKSNSPDNLCRLCDTATETQQHLMECPKITSPDDPPINLQSIIEEDVDINNQDIEEICRRISAFHDMDQQINFDADKKL